MTLRWLGIVLVAAGLLGLICLPETRADDTEPRTVEELFARSAEAYAALPTVQITFTTSMEIPEGEPAQDRLLHYFLGKGRQAVLEIGEEMRIVVTNDHVYAERAGVGGRFLRMAVEGDDLAAALEAVRGKSPLAGFWIPPQAALRARKTVDEVVEAFRYSRLLEGLSVEGLERAPGSGYELRLVAANGSCRARFNPETFYLTEVEYLVKPAGAPEGYAMRLEGRFTTREIADPDGVLAFDEGGRTGVESLRDLVNAPPGVSKPPEAIMTPEALSERLLGLDELAQALRDKRVLLLGEDHLYEEPPAFAAKLLEKLADRPISLLLELPADAQPAVDSYLLTGDENLLDQIFTGKPVLQLQHLLRWARRHRDEVPTVLAFDEAVYGILLKRAYATDTRNVTMSRRIHREWTEHPGRRIVAYAGQLHMLKAGRYLIDRPSRDTAGSRLPGLGVPPEEIAAVMLNGGDNFHLHAVWEKPGALPIDGKPGRIPIAYLIDYPIFGIEFADEAFDYFVNLGPLTRIEVKIE